MTLSRSSDPSPSLRRHLSLVPGSSRLPNRQKERISFSERPDDSDPPSLALHLQGSFLAETMLHCHF